MPVPRSFIALAFVVGMVWACGDSSTPPELSPCQVVAAVAPGLEDVRVLIFTKTAGFRHESIAAGVAAISDLGRDHGFAVEHTEDAGAFSDTNLDRFAAIVFLNTTGDVLDADQEAAFQRYVRGGGGFAGVHSATDTEHEWAWYLALVGAEFLSHPSIQQATVHVIEETHPSTRCVPAAWTRTDEWYDFRSRPAADVRILATVDETTYEGATMGSPHPMAWYHHFEGGRAWYTAMGHTTESYAEPDFLAHLLGGILWAAGLTPDVVEDDA